VTTEFLHLTRNAVIVQALGDLAVGAASLALGDNAPPDLGRDGRAAP
jgi:hypothetical protein